MGSAATQMSLLPECLDDYIPEDSPVRVVEAFIDALDLDKLGFSGVVPQSTGRPAYHPSVMLKIYVYGYLNRVHSTRRLERECQRNIELMWLTGRLARDFKTIANFRKDNGDGIRQVCKEFVSLCSKLKLISRTTVVIDGSKFKGVNNRDRNDTPGKLKRRREELERSIDRYLYRLDKMDQKAEEVVEIQAPMLKEKIASLKEALAELDALEPELNESEDKQISLTDPESRSLRTRGTGIVGYNVQTAVEPDNHLIVAHAVTNQFNDHRQLSPMAIAAKEAMGVDELDAVADRGYFKGEEVLACDEAGIAAYVPRTTGKERRVTRWEREDVLDAMGERLERRPEMMRLRRDTVEHPFGTLKRWMGAEHFLTKGLHNTGTEMSLHVLAYNMKRVIAILGIKALLEALYALFTALFIATRRSMAPYAR
jgi:transposase